MKKLRIMMAMLTMAAVVGFSSCGDDEDDATVEDAKITLTVRKVVGNTATIISSGASIERGDSIFAEITFTGNDKNKLKSYQTLGSWSTTPLRSGTLSGTTQTITDGTVTSAFVAGAYTYTVTVTSDKGTITQAFNFTITEPQGVDYEIATAQVQLGTQQNANLGSFWNSTDDVVYRISGINSTTRKLVDFVYYTNSNLGTLGSPRASSAANAFPVTITEANWPTLDRRDTRIELTTLSALQFNGATTEEQIDNLIATAVDAATFSQQSLALNNDAVYVFRTADNLFGLLYVAQATAGTDGTLDCIVKYQRIP